jgi:hypothetical protein
VDGVGSVGFDIAFRVASEVLCHLDDASEGELRKWLLASGQLRATRSRFRFWIARRGPPDRVPDDFIELAGLDATLKLVLDALSESVVGPEEAI